MSLGLLALTFAGGVTVGLIGNVVLGPLMRRRDGLAWTLLVASAALVLFLLPALALGISPGRSSDMLAGFIYLTGALAGPASTQPSVPSGPDLNRTHPPQM